MSEKKEQVEFVENLTSIYPFYRCLHNEQPFYHYENTPIQIFWKFYNQKKENFQIKILIFFIFLLKTLIVGTR